MPSILSLDLNNHQTRQRWTKAKKKRVARYDHRQRLQKLGLSVPKPPNYMPKDTPVLSLLNAEQRESLRLEMDAKATLEIQERREEQLARNEPLVRHHFDGLVMSDRVKKLFDLQNGNQREVFCAQKQRAMEIFQTREGDSGSSAVQVVALTTRIQQMQAHFAKHKKDHHNKRTMQALFTRRRKLLNYMERKDFESYRKVVKTLGLNR